MFAIWRHVRVAPRSIFVIPFCLLPPLVERPSWQWRAPAAGFGGGVLVGGSADLACVGRVCRSRVAVALIPVVADLSSLRDSHRPPPEESPLEGALSADHACSGKEVPGERERSSSGPIAVEREVELPQRFEGACPADTM